MGSELLCDKAGLERVDAQLLDPIVTTFKYVFAVISRADSSCHDLEHVETR